MLTQKQKEVHKRFRLRHIKKMRAKDRKRYRDNRQSELGRNKAYYPAYYKKHGEVIRLRRRCYIHGCTVYWLKNKQKEQKNRCAICNQVFKKTPHVDHDHRCCPSTKRFSCGNCNRGLLCDDCNLGLGRFKDSPKILRNAIKYIKDYNNG